MPESSLPLLAACKGAGAIGLLVAGLAPLLGAAGAVLMAAKVIGTAAVAGVLAYFIGALIVHLRARYYSVGPAASFLTLAIAVLVLGLRASVLV